MQSEQTTLEFPEIEGTSVQELDDIEAEKKRKQQFKGKRRFNLFAKRVIGQLAMAKEAAGEHTMSRSNSRTNLTTDVDTKPERKFQKPPLRRVKSFMAQPNTASSRGLQTQCSLNTADEHKTSFASIVRLARSRRLARADDANISASEPEDVVADVDTSVTPRFSATLSAEAQYAMLKGYEDVLRDNLTSGEAKANNSRLVRVKTPRRNVLSLQLSDNQGQSKLQQREQETGLPIAIGVTSPGSDPGRKLPQTSTPIECDKNTSSAILSRAFSRPPEVYMPKQTQLRLSKRFESAMTLLDRLKDPDRNPSQAVATNIDSHVDSYNSWSRSWVREFKLEFPRS